MDEIQAFIQDILLPALTVLIDSSNSAAGALSDLSNTATSLSDQMSSGLSALTGKIQELNAVQLNPGQAPTAPPPPSPKGGSPGGEGGGGPAEEVGAVLKEALLPSLGNFTGKLTEAVGIFSQLTAAVAPLLVFVKEFSPATVELFNQTIRDLNATIGSGFTPIIQVMISMFRQLSGIILPLIQDLTPILKDIATTIANNIITQFRLLVSVIQLLLPLLQIYADLSEQLNSIVRLVVDLFTVLVRTISSFIGKDTSDFKAVFKTIADTIKEAIKWLVQFTAVIVRAIGGVEFLNRFKAGLDKLIAEKEAAVGGLKAAPRDLAIESVESIFNKLNLAAAGAAGGGEDLAKSDNEYLKEISKALGDAIDGPTLETILNAWFTKLVEAISGLIPKPADFIPFATGPSPYIPDDFSVGSFRRAAGRAGDDLLAEAGKALDNPLGYAASFLP